jgi:hypothetical protein
MADETATTRRCIGSARFGIEPHDARVENFPKQPSQKDGLGRMCKTHWNQYTSALRKAALARKAVDDDVAATTSATEPDPGETPKPIRTRAKRSSKAVARAAGSQGDAG